MDAFTSSGALDLPLESERVADEQRLGGDPLTGYVELRSYRNATVGLWEMSAGTMRDVEADEVFVVLAGDATVELLDGDTVTRTIELFPGSLCRLEEGMVTRWHVTSPLRKLYVTGEPR
jgi:uncharacterized protein